MIHFPPPASNIYHIQEQKEVKLKKRMIARAALISALFFAAIVQGALGFILGFLGFAFFTKYAIEFYEKFRKNKGDQSF